MTRHRLVRCPPDQVLAQVLLLSGDSTSSPGSRVGRRTARWRQTSLGGVLDCSLDVDRGATGSLVHLSVTTASGALQRLPPALRRLALEGWSAQRLSALVREVERAA